MMTSSLALFLFLSLAMVTMGTATPTPVVMWHGMGDECCSAGMNHIKSLIEAHIPGVYVKSLRIGKDAAQDTENGFLMNVNKQIDYVCNELAQDKNLTNGFHGIGFSQGGQFLRAYVQRCNKPAMKNLVSVGGQHQGVFGFPRCPGNNNTLCEITRKLLAIGAYEKYIQETIVQAQYYQDPLKEEEYAKASIFIAEINNQKGYINQTYIQNLQSLNKFVMVKFNYDSMVQPRESEWFGFYAPGQDKLVLAMNETSTYTDNLLGLEQMSKNDQLVFLDTNGDHLQFTDQWFIDNLVPYLAQ